MAVLKEAVANRMTSVYGTGPWSSFGTVRGVLAQMRAGRYFIAKHRGRVVAKLWLGTRKPWAIDPRYFTPCKRPLYLLDMAVAPALQRTGLGRQCLDEARRIGREWPADAIRLDAYDAAAGAGGFYARCGFADRGRAAYRNAPLAYFETLL